MLELIETLRSENELNAEQIELAANQLLTENGDISQKTHFLKELANKGETPSEIASFVKSFLKHAVDPMFGPDDCQGPSIDVCGTGGDKLDLFNISTASVFVLAAGGATVVKHGNRGITSKSGGADVLEELGVPIDLPVQDLRQCVIREGAGFLFAPLYHPAFKAVVPVRKELASEGIRTVFNLIGPLLNPVKLDYQLVGVFDPELTSTFANILGKLGRKKAWAVHGKGPNNEGMDELSLCSETKISEWGSDEVNEFSIRPEDFDLSPCTLDDLKGGDPKENAAIINSILSNEGDGPKRDIIALNAAAGFVVTGIASDIGHGLEIAQRCIKDGTAMGKLDSLRNFKAN